MIEAAAIFAALPPAEETAIRSHIGELAAEVGRFVPVVVGYAHAIWVGWAQSSLVPTWIRCRPISDWGCLAS